MAYKFIPTKRYAKGNVTAELEKRPRGYRIRFFVDDKYLSKINFHLGKPYQTMQESRSAAMSVIKANDMKLIGAKKRKR